MAKLMDQLPTPFRERIKTWARNTIADDALSENQRDTLVGLLGILRDEWLVSYLRGQVETRFLSESEHRALIYLNSFESIVVYAESAEEYLHHLSELPRDEDPSGIDRASIWHRFVLLQGDINMFACDQLVVLVEEALRSPRKDHNWFGVQWTELLRMPRLAPLYSAVLQRHRGSFAAIRASMVENLCSSSSFDQIREIYEGYDDKYLRGRIVHFLHKCPGQATVDFLIARLSEPEYQFDAIQSLGFLRAYEAGSSIHNLLPNEPDRLSTVVLNALGNLGYRPAFDDFVNLLEKVVSENEGESAFGGDSTLRSNIEYSLLTNLRRIGGEEAIKLLADSYHRAEPQHSEWILHELLVDRTPAGIAAAQMLLTESEVQPSWVVSAITRPDFREGLVWPRELRALENSALEAIVQEEAARCVEIGKVDGPNSALEALASFNSETAQTFLVEVASGTVPTAEEREILAPSIHPVFEARRLLALRGHPLYQNDEIESELELIDRRDWVSSHDIERLGRWPEDAVREVLRRRLNNGRSERHSLWLLQWYAEESDIAIFRKYTEADDVDIADIAHRYLGMPHRRHFLR